MALNRTMLFILVLVPLINITCVFQSPYNTQWFIFFKVENIRDSTGIGDVSFDFEFNNEILIDLTPSNWDSTWNFKDEPIGLFRIFGGSYELNSKKVKKAILNTDFYITVQKDSFSTLDTVLAGSTFTDTSVNNYPTIYMKAPTVYLKPLSNR
jgi:hypothetical protein